jgi:hypothetical protein
MTYPDDDENIERQVAAVMFERQLAAYEAALDGFVPSAELLAAVAESNPRMRANSRTTSCGNTVSSKGGVGEVRISYR